MSPELINAVKERIELGHAKENIQAELKTAGYSDEAIAQVFATVEAGLKPVPTPPSGQVRPTDGGELVLPSTSDLISAGFNFVFKRTDILLWLAIPYTIVSILESLSSSVSVGDTDPFGILVGVGSLFASIIYIVVSAAALYTVTHNGREVSLAEATTWAKKNIWSFLWVSILTMLVIMGGFALFLIPGLIVGVSIYFSQYIFANEGIKGMAALRRSRQLTSGYWWPVANKLASVLLATILIFIIVGLLIGIIAGLSGVENATETLLNIVGHFFSAVGIMVGLTVGSNIYQALLAKSPVGTVSEASDSVWQYWVLAMLGPIFVISFFLMMIYGMAMITYQGSARLNDDTSIIDLINEDRKEAKERALELRLEESEDVGGEQGQKNMLSP